MSSFKSSLTLDQALDTITEGAEQGLRYAVEHALTEANKTVPHDEGKLEQSGAASASGLRGAVSYDTPYAVRQHEDMSLRHDGKGRAKWLEDTLATERHTMGQIVATTIRSEVGT